MNTKNPAARPDQPRAPLWICQSAVRLKLAQLPSLYWPVPILLTSVFDIFFCTIPDGVETDPHGGTQEGGDQHCDGGAYHPSPRSPTRRPVRLLA